MWDMPTSMARLRLSILLFAAIGAAGCGDSKPPDSKIANVEQTVKELAEPPGSYVAVLIGGRSVRLSQPAMRIKSVALPSNEELVVTYIAFRGGEKKTENIKISTKEGERIQQFKTVSFALGGARVDVESFPLDNPKTNQ